MVLLKALLELRVTPEYSNMIFQRCYTSDHTVRRASVRLLSERPRRREESLRRVAPQLGKTTCLPLYLFRDDTVKCRCLKTLPFAPCCWSSSVLITDCRSNQCSLFRGSRVVARYSTSVKAVVGLSPEKRDRFGVKSCCGSRRLAPIPILEEELPFLLPFQDKDSS
jgi:hypothetical protein